MCKGKQHKNQYNHYTEDFRREAVRRSNESMHSHPAPGYVWSSQKLA